VDDIDDDCDCERLQDNFRAMRTDYQEHHEHVYYCYRIGIEETIKTDTKSEFLGTLRVGYPLVKSFEAQFASGS
jgi:hypothetical protein